MAENHSSNIEESKLHHGVDRDVSPEIEHGATDVTSLYVPSLPGDPALSTRVNSSPRSSTLLGMQQTHGNRAVQRSLQAVSSRQNLVSVQRGWFDDATGWVGDKASGAANWASKEASDVAAHPLDSLAAAGAYVPIPGNPLQLAKTGHDINQLFGAGHNEQGDATPSLFEKGVNWMRDGSEKGANDLVAQTADIPVLGTLARANASVSKFTGDVTSGALKAVGGMVGGIGGMLEHPLDTAMGLEKVAENVGLPSYMNPFRMAHGVYDVASGKRGVGDAAEHWLDPIEQQKQSQEFFGNMFMGQEGKDGKRHGGMVEGYRNDWNEGRYGSMIGRAGVDIGSFFIGGGEANAASKVGEAGTALRAVGEAGTVVRGLEEAGQGGTVLHGMEEAGQGTKAIGATADAVDASKAVQGGTGGAGAANDAAHAAGGDALLPGISDTEMDMAMEGAKGGPMVQAPPPTGLRLGRGQSGYWGKEPGTGMTVQEYQFPAQRGLPVKDAGGNIITPAGEGDLQTNMRIHSADATAPTGSASNQDWTMGFEQVEDVTKASGKVEQKVRGRMTEDGKWFDPAGGDQNLKGYKQNPDGTWVNKGMGKPVTKPGTLEALREWMENMASSHIPLP